ncbi:hypothetical protein [Flavobacterium chungnamense]|uniref:Uncharacterized protein n=1 Tax=Flavobacterium chungnamense TaxID=706182 RepID=A0ABP7UVU0_9FLAO
MSYKKWNEALIDYYFNENKTEEVILYCDEEIINEIGTTKNIGLLTDFINCVLADENERFTIFDSLFIKGGRDTRLNGKIKTNSDLKFSIVLYDTGIDRKIPMTFFSYIILSILKNTISVENANYKKLQTLKNPSEYDSLFYSIEKAYPKFINRKIGKHRYEGLIKFQIVLTNDENVELEKILYKNQLEFSEYESYETIMNRVLRYSDGKLRDKLQRSTTDECYKIWFENKLKNFKLENYVPKITDEPISIHGEFALAFVINNEFSGLQLFTNVNPKEILINNGITIFPCETNSKLENGFFQTPVQIEKVEFKEYKFEKLDINIKSSSLNDIVFFQKINNHLYFQTLNPYPNTETYILVKKEDKLLNKFKSWAKEKIEYNEIPIDNSKNYFGETHILFISNNISESYYKIDKNDYFKLDSKFNKIQRIGGLKPIGTVNTYLEIALPQFKINIPEFEENRLKIIYLRKDLNNIEDTSCFGYLINSEIVTIFLKDPDFQFDTINIQINFNYDRDEIGSFDFLIESSKMNPISIENDFVKLDKWGQETNVEPFYNILSFKGTKAIANNNNRQKITTEDNPRNYSDYFVHLLCAVFYKNSIKNYIEKHQLKEIYLQTLLFLNSQEGINLIETNYSFNNLLKYLIDLGFIQRKIITNTLNTKECYVLVPPTFTKIEKSFTDGGNQIYLITGLYNRKFTFLVKKVAEENNVVIKFRKIKTTQEKEKLPETFLLPDLILIDHNFPFDKFESECSKNGLDFIKEEQINIANSLLNFSASVSDFEAKFKDSSDKIENNDTLNDLEKELKSTSEENFPRIRVLDTKQVYKAPTYFVEMQKNVFYKYNQTFSSKWLNLYIKNKRKDPVIIYRKKRSDKTNFTYFSEIYLYKYDQFPTLLTKSLTFLNIGLPTEKKIFVCNSKFNKQSKEFPFNVFLEYNISSDVDRRKKIAKILTGSDLIEENEQIIDSVHNDYDKIKMELFTIKMIGFNQINKFILIKKDGLIISLITLGNYYKPHSVYISPEIIQSIQKNEINIDGQSFSMAKIVPSEDINSIISAILKNDTEKINGYQKIPDKTKIVTFQTEDYITEDILIISNY